MKKLLFVLAVCVLSVQSVFAGRDVPITFEKLPAAAQQFVKQHFPDAQVVFVTMDTEYFSTDYDVLLNNGDKLEFNKQGEWKEVKCRASQVPDAVVPEPVKKFVAEHYPDAKIVQMEKDRYEYEVQLNNFWEITFDTSFNVIDMDMDD